MTFMNLNIKVAIADDHPMVVKGIQNMLQEYTNIEIVHVFEHGKQILPGIKELEPDVLLLDLHMPGIKGYDLLPQLIETYPSLAVLVLTNSDQPNVVQEMFDKGALGYLLKSTDQKTLMLAIENVYRGKQYLDIHLKESFIEYAINENKRKNSIPAISRREKEVLGLIVDGFTNQEIAAKLFLGQRTVETYRLNLMTKLDVKNTASLVRKAIQEQLI